MLTTMLAPSQARHKLKTSEVRCERRSAACPVVSLTVAQTEVNTIHFKALHQECPVFTVNTAAGLFFPLPLSDAGEESQPSRPPCQFRCTHLFCFDDLVHHAEAGPLLCHFFLSLNSAGISL